jgi:predicted nucleic acid-binding protein
MSIAPMVILDTNVLEAAFRSRRGASFELLSKVGTGKFEIALSVTLVLEYQDVLGRQGPTTRSPTAVKDVLDYLCLVARRQRVFYLWRPCLNDPKDDHVLELAVAASCDAIVTHNVRDFSTALDFGIRAVSPGTFLKDINE